MSLELRDIPPAPRGVRTHAVVWRAFGACLAGSVLLIYGGVLTLLLWISDRGSYYTEAERSLDREREVLILGPGAASAVVGREKRFTYIV